MRKPVLKSVATVFICSVLGMSLVGCEPEKEATQVTTKEDEIAAYEALIEADQKQTADDAAVGE